MLSGLSLRRLKRPLLVLSDTWSLRYNLSLDGALNNSVRRQKKSASDPDWLAWKDADC
jgi:hypothetical protein